MRKTFAAAGMTAALLGGATAGTFLLTPSPAGAQTDDTTSTMVAVDDSTDGGQREPGAWVQDTLDQLVADGTITQEQSDAVLAALQANRPEHGPGGSRHLGQALESAATALGTTVDELRTALRDGQTIADVAAANGVDTQTVIDTMVAEATAAIQDRLAAGEIDQERADEILGGLAERITDLVENGPPARGEHGMHA